MWTDPVFLILRAAGRQAVNTNRKYNFASSLVLCLHVSFSPSTGPKQEVGNHNSGLFLPLFLLSVMRFAKLNKPPLSIKPPPKRAWNK